MFFLLVASLFFRSLHLAYAYEDPRFTRCGNTATYTANSTFAANLAVALNTLQNTTAPTGFNATTAGNLTDPVTVLALCRASLSMSDCKACVDAATLGIRRACPNQTEAQVWYSLCTVRYSGVDFVNKPDSTVAFMLYDVRDVPNQDSYDPKVKTLMQKLSYAAGVSEKRSAVGRTRMSDNRTINGYVDCTRDINGDDCTACLLYATDEIRSCCLGKWAGWIATPTCNIQFNMDPVHDDWINPPEINTDMALGLGPSPGPVIRPPTGVDKGGSDGGRSRADGTKRIVISVAVIVTVILVVWAVLVVIWRRKRERVLKREEEMGETMRNDIGIRSFLYDLEELVAATDNFSSANRLGGGGFGSVYRGKLRYGEEIAVKKLAAGSMQGIVEFSNEVRLLVKMQHRNLVQLLGCCVQGEEMMLVYEYLPNKSLDCFLFDKTKSALLDWRKRFNIIIGVARGLQYLHEDSQLRIIHRDIKAGNVLLDQQMNPKISDFGLARLFDDEQSHLRTRRIAGTFGYMAPEYAIRGMVSVKSDIFSFGVLILETISGRKNFDLQLDEEEHELLNFTRKLKQEGRLMELVDVTIGSFPQDDVLRFITIGLLCCQECVEDRPTISSTLIMLTNNSVTIPPLGRLGYQGSRDNTAMGNATMNPRSQGFSKNSISLSFPHGR